MEFKRLSVIFFIYIILCLFFAIYFIFYFDKKYLKLIQKNGDSTFNNILVSPLTKQLKTNSQEIKDSIQKLQKNIAETRAAVVADNSADNNDEAAAAAALIRSYVSDFSREIEAKLEAAESIAAGKISLDLHKTISDESKAIITALESNYKKIEQQFSNPDGKTIIAALESNDEKIQQLLAIDLRKTFSDESKVIISALENNDKKIEKLIGVDLQKTLGNETKAALDESLATASENIDRQLSLVAQRTEQKLSELDTKIALAHTTLNGKVDATIQSIDEKLDTFGEKINCSNIDSMEKTLLPQSLSIGAIDKKLNDIHNSADEDTSSILEKLATIENNLESVRGRFVSVGGRIEETLQSAIPSKINSASNEIQDKMDKQLVALKKQIDDAQSSIEENCGTDSIKTSINSVIIDGVNSCLREAKIVEEINKSISAAAATSTTVQLNPTKVVEDSVNSISQKINSVLEKNNNAVVEAVTTAAVAAAAAQLQQQQQQPSATTIAIQNVLQKLASEHEAVKKKLDTVVAQTSQQQQQPATLAAAAAAETTQSQQLLETVRQCSEDLLQKITNQLSNVSQQNEMLNNVNDRLLEIKRGQDNSVKINDFRRQELAVATRLENVYKDTQNIVSKVTDAIASGPASSACQQQQQQPTISAELEKRLGGLEEIIKSTAKLLETSTTIDQSSKSILVKVDDLKKKLISSENSQSVLGQKLDQVEQVCLVEMRQNVAEIKRRLDEPTSGNDISAVADAGEDRPVVEALLKKIDGRTRASMKSLDSIAKSIDHIPTIETIRPTVEKIETVFSNNIKMEEKLTGIVHGNERIEQFLATEALGKLGKISTGSLLVGAGGGGGGMPPRGGGSGRGDGKRQKDEEDLDNAIIRDNKIPKKE